MARRDAARRIDGHLRLVRRAVGRAVPALTRRTQLPTAAAGYVQRSTLARMFNEYGAGGFLIYKLYPQVPVAIDGRSEFYGNRVLSGYYTIFRAEDGWAPLLDEWGADLALISPQSPLAKALRADAAWVEEFTDDEASVFVRRAAAGDPSR
jgi:hypothetical protein